jgi:hypothetical protein
MATPLSPETGPDKFRNTFHFLARGSRGSISAFATLAWSSFSGA